jgi:hypothetical protein
MANWGAVSMMLTISKISFAVSQTGSDSIGKEFNGNVTGYYGYKTEDIVMLTDDAQNPRQRPTRDNIVSPCHSKQRNRPS